MSHMVTILYPFSCTCYLHTNRIWIKIYYIIKPIYYINVGRRDSCRGSSLTKVVGWWCGWLVVNTGGDTVGGVVMVTIVACHCCCCVVNGDGVVVVVVVSGGGGHIVNAGGGVAGGGNWQWLSLHHRQRGWDHQEKPLVS